MIEYGKTFQLLFFFIKITIISLDCRWFQPDIQVLGLGGDERTYYFLQCSKQMLIDLLKCQQLGVERENRGRGFGLDLLHFSRSMRGSAVGYPEHIYSCFKEHFVSLNLLALSVSVCPLQAGAASTEGKQSEHFV